MNSEAMNSNDPVHDVLHLCRLHDTARYTVAEDDPDVRGWDVITSDGTRIGRVDDLIVDPQAKKVQYLDVEIDNSLINRNDGNYLLVPIGLADIHEQQDQIIVRGIDSSTLSQHSFHSHGSITREYEESIRKNFDAELRSPSNIGREFYNHQQNSFSDEMFKSAFRQTRGRQKGSMPGLSGNVSAFNSGT